MYVFEPARRAFQTPENEVLVAALDAVRSVGMRTGWHRSATATVGADVRDRVRDAERWLHSRMLEGVERRPLTPKTLARVKSGRHRRRYQAALDVVVLYQRFMRRLDREAIRDAIEQHALAATSNDVLLELKCAFTFERALRAAGWAVSRPGLVRGGLFLRAVRGSERAEVYYQRTPKELTRSSIYGAVQANHEMTAGVLRPDFVIHTQKQDTERFLLIEVKGVERPVDESARAAIFDLLAYRRAFDGALAGQAGCYGLGIAWGECLDAAAESEIAVCSPDRIEKALGLILG